MTINGFLYVFSFTLFFTLAVFSSDPPEFSPSPSPAPELGSDDSYSVTSPAPSDLPPSPASSPSADGSSFSPSPSPSPSPSEASDMTVDVKTQESSSEGMSGGKKAGVAFGLIAAACFVGFGGVLYRKRQQNIRRAQYSYAARMDVF